MKVWETPLQGVLVIEPDVYRDARGYFMEMHQEGRYRGLGVGARFVQDNLSFSVKGTLRGLHFQYPNSQSKLVQAVQGEIYDVAADIRRGSPQFGRWTGVRLSSLEGKQVFIPAGFAHGFCVLSESAVVLYKCDDVYAPENEGGVIWSDPDLAIEWPISCPILSVKDGTYAALREIPAERLPVYGKSD